MTKEQIDAYFASLNDIELKEKLYTAYNDLRAVSKEDPDSEWHASCFAATILYTQELNKRGIKND